MMRYLASAPQHDIKNKYGFGFGGRLAFCDYHFSVRFGQIQQYAVLLVAIKRVGVQNSLTLETIAL
jgi:hypothetical protein